MSSNLRKALKRLHRGWTFPPWAVALMAAGIAAASAESLRAQRPVEPGPGDFYFENERYEPYSWFEDDRYVDYDDFYYDELYEDDRPYDFYADFYELDDGPYGDDDFAGEDYYDDLGDYDEDYYEEFGFGGYARHGYGYEGYTYDYYDDAYAGRDVYDDYYDYGVEEDRYYTDDWYEEVGALERWYD